MYVVKEKKTGFYIAPSPRYNRYQSLVDDISKARVFRSVSGAKASLTVYRWDIELKKGVKTIFDDEYDLIPIEITPKDGKEL